MASRTAPDYDGMFGGSPIIENETSNNTVFGLAETGGNPLALKVIFNPPLRWNLQQMGGHFQG